MSGAGRRPEVPKGRPAGLVSNPLGASRTLDDGVASPSHTLLPSGLEKRSHWVSISERWYRCPPAAKRGSQADGRARPVLEGIQAHPRVRRYEKRREGKRGDQSDRRWGVRKPFQRVVVWTYHGSPGSTGAPWTITGTVSASSGRVSTSSPRS